MSGLGVRLAPEQVLLLTHRTEGWAAALRLAAISLRDRSDPDEFVRAFAGNDRAVADYLVEEVLGRLPASLARFLLCTSIVERFTADLAAGLTGDDQADLVLDSLDRDYSLVAPSGRGAGTDTIAYSPKSFPFGSPMSSPMTSNGCTGSPHGGLVNMAS
jgi:LuxR family maltose regulon positive regulatory protein